MRGEFKNRINSSSQQLLLVGFEGGFPAFLKRLLMDENPSIQISELATVDEALRSSENRPNVVLFDEGCCQDIASRQSDVKRVFDRAIMAMSFSGHLPSVRSFNACTSGRLIKSYLPMDMRIEVWLAAINLMLKGGRYICPAILDDLLAKVAPGPKTASDEDVESTISEIELLTPREMEVLHLVALGQQNKSIAAELGLSENTVKLHMHHIITKLNASNRTEAAAAFHVHMAAERAHGHVG